MKTSTKTLPYDQVMALKRPQRKKPRKPNLFWRCLVRFLCIFGMMGTKFSYETERMELLGKKEPCLILMNHSCFQDMEVANMIMFPRPMNIVASNEAFVGLFGLMEWVMRSIGGIPTQKFVSDVRLVKNMEYCLKELKSSVLMYPEAAYSFDGTATTMPAKMGILLKKLDVPVVMIRTYGAFSRNPLYNELKIRRHVPIKAKATLLYTREEIKEKTVRELSEGVQEAFGFDNFRWQQEQGLKIHQDFRADGLHRILFKCVHCGAEGQMEGRGTGITCRSCGKHWELTELGRLEAADGNTEIDHIPDYYRWEREQLRQQILEGSYKLDVDVDVLMQVDNRTFYRVGRGHLVHDLEGFTLTGADGRLYCHQKPMASNCLYADYYWYELGDVIGLGDTETFFFCFPPAEVPVARIRLAAEEMYKLYKSRAIGR